MHNINKKGIAILGATGHIGKALVYWISKNDEYYFHLYSRSKELATKIFEYIWKQGKGEIKNYEDLDSNFYEAVINCVGIGDPAKLINAKLSIFQLTEKFDNLVIGYLQKHPETVYINISSGAIYGKEFSDAANENSILAIKINHIEENDYYAIAKLQSEAKHRALADMNIVDLRVFGFFSRFIDLSTNYFMADVVRSIIQKKELITNSFNMIRDYVSPKDLANLVMICIEKRFLNKAYDVFSKKPISKFAILDKFNKNFGLKFKISNEISFQQATGGKLNYYSNYQKAKEIGYYPSLSSLETLMEETKFLLEK